MPSRNDNANHYDQETVVLRGKGTNVKKQQQRDGNTQTVGKFDPTKSHEMRKLEENEIGKITKINSKVIIILK